MTFDARSLLQELARRRRPAPKTDQLEANLTQWCPHKPTPKQWEFLRLSCFEALYGGGAGGGKTDCVLMDVLRGAHLPYYSALITRKKFTDLSLPGAVMDRAKSWWIPRGAHWNDRDKSCTFPSGARVQFGYLDTDMDMYRYQGSEFQRLIVDEATQIPERRYKYLLSRLRKPVDMPIDLAARLTSNPGGIGHRWVKERFVDEATRGLRQFVPALLADNPHLDQETYRESLAQLDPTTRAQLERGEWVENAGDSVFTLDPRDVYDDELPCDTYILGVDLGASQSVASTAFTLIGFWSWKPEVQVVMSYARSAMTPSSIADEITEISGQYQLGAIVVDAGALGKGYVEEFRVRHGIPAKAAQKNNRAAYIRLLAGEFSNRKIHFVRGATEPLRDELRDLRWDEEGKDVADGCPDHCTDALIYAWREARGWAYQEKPRTIAYGTKEWYAAEEARMERVVQQAVREAQDEEDYG